MAETWPQIGGTDINYKPLTGSMRVSRPSRARLQTEMQEGPVFTRRLSSKSVGTTGFQLLLSNAEFAVFKAWVRDTLVDGTLQFNMPIWTGSAYETKLCQMLGEVPYEDHPQDGLRHVVSMTLEVEDW